MLLEFFGKGDSKILTFLQWGWGVGRDEKKKLQVIICEVLTLAGVILSILSCLHIYISLYIYLSRDISEVIVNQPVLRDRPINNLCNSPFNMIFSKSWRLYIFLINSPSPFYFTSAMFYFSCKLDSSAR